jgi:hypothetical protein
MCVCRFVFETKRSQPGRLGKRNYWRQHGAGEIIFHAWKEEEVEERSSEKRGVHQPSISEKASIHSDPSDASPNPSTHDSASSPPAPTSVSFPGYIDSSLHGQRPANNTHLSQSHSAPNLPAPPKIPPPHLLPPWSSRNQDPGTSLSLHPAASPISTVPLSRLLASSCCTPQPALACIGVLALGKALIFLGVHIACMHLIGFRFASSSNLNE